jgi:pimeloyl-ACP methyl ester carboxylesterase
MKNLIAQTSRGPIEYTMTGSGPVVLNIHGTSSDCFSTPGLAPLAENGFSLLTPSRPGYGRTPRAVGKSAAEAADALIALLDTLKIETCSVVAVSGGGPTGLALAARFPRRVQRLVLVEAIAQPESRPQEPGYQDQVTFYGPLHRVLWGMLGLMSRLSPRRMARQCLAIFSTHNPDDALHRLTQADILQLARFFRGRSSRQGAVNDLAHTVGEDTLRSIRQPTLVIHSREDRAVPFSHAEWALKHIPQAELCEAGFTGHFFWVGPDFPHLYLRINEFLK